MKPQRFTREERLLFAKEFSEKIKSKFKEKLLTVGIYGSVAREKDQPYSDLEMLVVLKGLHPEKTMEGIYKGLKYEINFCTKNEIKKNIRTIDIDWPVNVGQYLKILPLFDPQKVFDDFAKEYEKVVKKSFKPYTAEVFTCDLYDLFCKFFNAKEGKEYQSMRFITFVLCDKVSKFIGLINKRYYHSLAEHPQDAIKMPINFPSFIELTKKVLSGKTEDAEELSTLIEKLYQEIIQYFEEEGIQYHKENL